MIGLIAGMMCRQKVRDIVKKKLPIMKEWDEENQAQAPKTESTTNN